jgi:hypothetical protein
VQKDALKNHRSALFLCSKIEANYPRPYLTYPTIPTCSFHHFYRLAHMKNLDRKTIPIVLYSKSAYIATQNSRFYRAKQALLQRNIGAFAKQGCRH